MTTVDPIAERIGKNEAAFRDANERVRRRAAAADLPVVPFLCECADRDCTAVVQLRLDEYEQVRAEPTWFLYAVSHERNALGFGEVVSTKPGYLVVEKVGDAAEVAAELDPRTNTQV
jgi:hypothetical protein